MTDADTLNDQPAPGLFANLPDILWQRRWLISLPMTLGLVAGTAAAFLIKPVYTSKATILIESQQLPDSIADTSVNDLIDQRIARVRQRILSRPDLVRIIRAQKLYVDEQNSQPLSRIVERMRRDTAIDPISADVQTGRGGAKSTIAFAISFNYGDPQKAQLVAQQYANNFLELDASTQAENAVGAANFLNEQASQIQDQIRAIENQITAIKSQNGSLLAMQQMSTGNPIADAARIDSEIAAIMAENARAASAGSAASSPEAAAVTQITAQLRAAQAKYSETHPDVLALKAQLETARAAASSAGDSNASAGIIASNNGRIASLRAAKGMILSQGAAAQANQSRAPVVAERVAQLEAQATGLRAQYQTIGNKLMNAQVSAKMETEQKGERLTLSDPPVVPEVPTSPNRPLLIAGGAAAGLGLGLALILLLELVYRPIRGTQSLAHAAGRAPLVVIPDLETKPHFILRFLQSRSRRKLARNRARSAA